MFDSKISSMGYQTTGSSVIYGGMMFVSSALGPLHGYIVKTSTYQFSAVSSALVIALGTLGTAFASQFWHLLISCSVIVGLGIGLLNTASVIAISNFFDKWKSTAMAFNCIGYSAATFLFPPLIAFLQKEYGYWGTQMLLTAITLNVVVVCLLFHPLSRHGRKKLEVQALTVDGQSKKDNKRLLRMWSSMFDCELLRNPAMIVAFIICTTVLAVDCFFSMYVSGFLHGKLDLSQDEVAQCFVVRGCVDFVASFILPYIIDKLGIGPKYVLAVCTVGVALTRIGLTFTSNLVSIYVLIGFEGLFRGQAYVFTVITIADISPHNKIAAAYGLSLFFQGMGALIISPILGYIRDWTQSYDIVVHISSALALLAVSIWLKDIIVYVIRRCKHQALKNPVSDENA